VKQDGRAQDKICILTIPEFRVTPIKTLSIKQLSHLTLLKGVRELAERDADLARIASTYGPPPLWEREPGFHTLIHIILEQQVSLASAQAAYNRLEQAIQPLAHSNSLLTDGELKRISSADKNKLWPRAGRCYTGWTSRFIGPGQA
jgi:DNA-3-methyladenine glycosylase II